jgi:protoheme IX farnesyltransferase
MKSIAIAATNYLVNWRDYYELTKPKVVALLVFTAMVGMFLASPGMVPWQVLFFGTLGIGLSAGAAAAINHLVDHQADRIMARTRRRPIPQGHIDVPEALFFALIVGALGLTILAVFVNLLTAVLTFMSLIMYAVIYTMYLKRATPQNIVIGGAAGAAPPVLGWTAVTGSIDPHALLLFLIIFVWTPPHFWALAIHRCGDYAKADIPMLPVTHGIEHTKIQVILYTVLLTVVTVLPWLTGMFGPFYLGVALVLDGVFLYYTFMMQFSDRPGVAIRTFVYSIFYLMVLFAGMLVDHYIPIVAGLIG